MTAAKMGGRDRGEAYYLRALEFSQSLWREGKPAQAILQLNKAWMADLRGDEPILREWPSPYRAMVWMLAERAGDLFVGNPVRHFQHLATRMNAVRTEPRRWRAWVGFHLASRMLDEEEYPRDWEQVVKEGIVIPDRDACLDGLAKSGWLGEVDLVRGLFDELSGVGTRPGE